MFTRLSCWDEYYISGSKEELSDLQTAYEDGKGNMDYIIDNVLLCTIDDEERFRKIIDNWIEEEKVEAYPAYIKETEQKKKQRKRKVK